MGQKWAKPARFKEDNPEMTDQVSVPSSAEVLPWYAIRVRTRSEPVAVRALRERGFDPFSPTVAERRRYYDRMSVVQTPVFPGYIFCRLDAFKKVAVLSCPAVEHIVSFGGIPTAVPEDEIEAVRRALEAGGRPSRYLNVGQRVRIEYGSLAGLEGILERIGKQQRINVSIHLLQRTVSVEIEEDQIRVLGPSRL